MTDTVNVPLDVVADAIDCFWNAALGAAHERQSEVAADLASVMVQGFAAIATRLREHAAAPKAEPVNGPDKLDLSAVIRWLENGCDTEHAIAELKIYQARLSHQPLSNPQQLPEAQKGEPKDDRTETCVKCCGNGEIVTDWEEYLSPSEGAPADHATADCPACDGIGKVHPVYTNPAPSSELLEVAEALIPIARKDTRLGKAGDNLRKALNRLEDAIAKHKGPQS